MNPYFKILTKAEDKGYLSVNEIKNLLEPPSSQEEYELTKAADRVRSYYMGDEIWLRGIIEFSNKCARNCIYCGLRAQNTNKWRYEMTIDEIVDTSQKIASLDIGTVVLQSGEYGSGPVERLKTVIKKIKAMDLAVTLSIGEYPREVYQELKRAGADRFLLRHETADSALYEKLHPGYRLEDRINALRILKEEDYEVGCGFMVGLPGQTLGILARDVLLCRDLEADMVGIGPFIPHPHTSLRDEKRGDFQMTLRVLAVIRLVCRDVHLPATTAMATIDELGREKAWQAGANVVMPTATPKPYREAYELYPDKKCLEDSVEHCRGCLEMRILSLGRKIGVGQGGSYKKRV